MDAFVFAGHWLAGGLVGEALAGSMCQSARPFSRVDTFLCYVGFLAALAIFGEMALPSGPSSSMIAFRFPNSMGYLLGYVFILASLQSMILRAIAEVSGKSRLLTRAVEAVILVGLPPVASLLVAAYYGLGLA